MAASMQLSMFGVALKRTLDSWTALQLAVQQGFGGPESREKATWMIQAIETWFNENEGLEKFEVEDFLTDILDSEFDLILEDNSIQEIANLICLFYRLCQENKVAELQQQLQSLPRAAIQGCHQGAEQAEFDEGEDMFSNQTLNPQPSTPQTQPPPPPSSSTQSDNATGNEDTMETDDTQEDSDGWRIMRHGKKKR